MTPQCIKARGVVAGLMLVLLAPPIPTQAADSAAATGAVAYPDNPSGTPQTGNNGAPVVTDKAACPIGTECPDKPPASASADSATTGGDKAQSGGVRTPATAYPNSPVPTPGADPSGTAPKQ